MTSKILVCFLAMLAAMPVFAEERSAANAVTGAPFTYSVRKGDFLISIASRFGVSEQVLARENDLKPPYRLAVGQRLRVDNRHLVPEALEQGIVINLPQRMLFLFRDGALKAAYPVALGRREWPTPTGNYQVIQREKNKTWIVPQSIQEEMRRAGKPVLTRVPPGPENPLGAYWIGLSLNGYGIHGTNAPASIYRMRTHGCIRLHPDDAAALYGEADPGMPVRIIYVPVLFARIADGRILVEVNPDVYNRGSNSLEAVRALAQAHGVAEAIDWTAVRRFAQGQYGVAREVGRVAAKREEPVGRRALAQHESDAAKPDSMHRFVRISGPGAPALARKRPSGGGCEDAVVPQSSHG